MARKNFKDLWTHKTYKNQLPLVFEEYIAQKTKEEVDDFFGDESVESYIYEGKKKVIEKELKVQTKEFVYLEMLFYFHHVTFNNRTVFFEKDPAAMFSNHEEKIYDGIPYQKHFYKKSVFLMKNLYSKKEMDHALIHYFSIPSAYRLFEKGPTKNTVSLNSHIKFKKSFRETLYQTVLHDPTVVQHQVKGKEKDIVGSDLKPNKILVWKRNKATDKMEAVRTDVGRVFTGSSYKENKKELFPMTALIERRNKEKSKSTPLTKTKVTVKDYQEMDKLQYKGWENRYNDLSIQEINEKLVPSGIKPGFTFKDINYVLGPLGSGKSTLSMGIIYRLVQEGKKIFIPVADTQLGFDLKEELREIGIENVAIFTGRKAIQSHRDNFIQNNAKKYNDVFEFTKKRKSDLDILDDTCYIRGKIELPKEEAHPCSNLTIEKDGKKEIYCCPMYDECGANHMYQEMVKADVWIGSYEAFLKSRAPYQWDKYERTFYELAILWSDLIIIDEVDIAQVRIDDAFKDVLSLVINESENESEKFFIDYLIKTESGADKNKLVGSIYTYGKAVTTAQEVSRYMFTHVLNKPRFFRELAKKTFTPYQMLYQWLETYTVQPINKPINEKLLRSLEAEFFYDVTNFTSKADPLRNQLEIAQTDPKKASNRQDHINDLLNTYIDRLFTSLKVKVKTFSGDKLLKRNRLFEFILFFYKFENAVQHLRGHYQEYTEKVTLKNNEKFKLDFIFPRNAHTLYAPDPLTENIYAYKLFYDRNKMKLKQVYYYGVGRNLMYKMHESFTHIEPHAKPALLFLSATSYSPKSSRFHLQIQPNWLIKSRKQANQKLNCFLSFFTDNGNVLTISGESDENKRFDNIRKIAKGMIQKNFLNERMKELKEAKQIETDILKERAKADPSKENIYALKQSKQERRGIVGIATSSFKNAEVFTQGLLDAGFPKEKIRTLYAPDKEIERKEYHISKNEVYDLYKEDIDVFVFVWKSIDRGFNILRGPTSTKSLISKMVFLNRPHPIPGDFSESIMFLHGYQQTIDSALTSGRQSHAEALGKMHQMANGKIQEVFSKQIAWSKLSNADRLIYGYNEFIPIGQTKGRGFRGGTDLDVYYVDGKFAEETAKTNSDTFIDKVDTSILAAWQEVLDSSHDPLKRELYGVFEDGLNNIQVDYY